MRVAATEHATVAVFAKVIFVTSSSRFTVRVYSETVLCCPQLPSEEHQRSVPAWDFQPAGVNQAPSLSFVSIATILHCLEGGLPRVVVAAARQMLLHAADRGTAPRRPVSKIIHEILELYIEATLSSCCPRSPPVGREMGDARLRNMSPAEMTSFLYREFALPGFRLNDSFGMILPAELEYGVFDRSDSSSQTRLLVAPAPGGYPCVFTRSCPIVDCKGGRLLPTFRCSVVEASTAEVVGSPDLESLHAMVEHP